MKIGGRLSECVS